MKLEFLGMKWAMTQKFCEYLLGHKCVVWTDNNPLSHLTTAKLGATEQRRVAELAVFDYTVRYHPGQSNQNADALSWQHPPWDDTVASLVRPGTLVPEIVHKCVVETDVPAQHAISAVPERSSDDLKALQGADPTISAALPFFQPGAVLGGGQQGPVPP